MIRPKLNVWVFAIGSEHSSIFGETTERLDALFDIVPVIPGLDETIQLSPSVFHTSNTELINIQFFSSKSV